MNSETVCPGCGLTMPKSTRHTAHGYYNGSPECWSVYTEVLEAEYSNPALFGRVHQLTVDTYAVQHAGGLHPDKSVAVHLTGLHLMLDGGLRPTIVPANLQQLARTVREWPHFVPPDNRGSVTVFDVALSDSLERHINSVSEWSADLWKAWSKHHAAIAKFVAEHLPQLTF